jgi:hypothetical protein
MRSLCGTRRRGTGRPHLYLIQISSDKQYQIRLPLVPEPASNFSLKEKGIGECMLP